MGTIFAKKARQPTEQGLAPGRGSLQHCPEQPGRHGNDANIADSVEGKFKRFLIEKYTKLLNTVVVSKCSQDIKIEDICTAMRRRADLEKEMLESGLLGKIHHETRSTLQKIDNDLIQSDDEIFMKDRQQLSNVYVLGKAGIGKTLFVMKLLQSWCRVKKNLPTCKLDHILAKFDFVFHVSLRYAEKSDTLRDMIYKQACYSVEQHIAVAKEVLQSRDKHCLILVDGLDEWAATASAVSSSYSKPGIPDREGLGRNCKVLTTSRPWRVEALEKGLGHDCRVLEIEGLDKAGVVALVTKLLRALKDPNNTASSNRFYEEIKELRMEELVKMPLILTNFVVAWHRSGHKLDKSLCMNYSGMFESLIQRALDSDSDRKSQASGGQAHEVHVPPCFASRNRCLQFWSLIQKLSHLAFHSLLGQEKERSLVFRKHDLVDRFGEAGLEECLKFGILSQSEADLESVDRTVSVSFVHKTFQEFLAAFYMSTSSWGSCLKTFQDRCDTVGDVLDLQLIIIFLSGLAPDRGSELCLHVAKLVNTDEGIKKYREAVGEVLAYTRSDAHVSIVVGLENMLLECYREAGDNHTDLSKQKLASMYTIHDIYIDDDVRPDACEMLCSHVILNASSIQSLVFAPRLFESVTPRVIMDALINMHHLQRLQLLSSRQQVVNCLELLCKALPKLQQLKALGLDVTGTRLSEPAPVPLQLVEALLGSAPSITSLYLEGLEIGSNLPSLPWAEANQVECQFPVNLVSLRLYEVSFPSNLLLLFPARSMRYLKMSKVTLSHTQIEALCGCLAASTSLQELELWQFSCRDCEDECCFRLDLSALKQLQHLWLFCLPVTRLSLDPRGLEGVDLLGLWRLESWESVLRSLTQAPRLRSLQLNEGSLSPGDVSALVTTLPQLQQLDQLALSGIRFGHQDIVTVSNMSKLRGVEFWSVRMSASGWRQFLHTLPRHQLKVSLCCECNVDEETMAGICSSPRYKVIHRDDITLEILTVPQTSRD